MNDCEDYIQTLETLKDLCPNCICDYVKMLFLDTICANPDRHTFNFGILRDIDTGDVLGLAPNFDNNMALISRGYPKNIKRKNDIFVSLFNELLEFDNRLKKYIPPLTEEIILKVIKSVGMRVRSKEITEFIMNGYNQIEAINRSTDIFDYQHKIVQGYVCTLPAHISERFLFVCVNSC